MAVVTWGGPNLTKKGRNQKIGFSFRESGRSSRLTGGCKWWIGDTHTIVIMMMITQPWLSDTNVRGWSPTSVKGLSFSNAKAEGVLWRPRGLIQIWPKWSNCFATDSLGEWLDGSQSRSWRLREYWSRAYKTVGPVSNALLTPKRASKNVRGVEKRLTRRCWCIMWRFESGTNLAWNCNFSTESKQIRQKFHQVFSQIIRPNF